MIDSQAESWRPKLNLSCRELDEENAIDRVAQSYALIDTSDQTPYEVEIRAWVAHDECDTIQVWMDISVCIVGTSKHAYIHALGPPISLDRYTIRVWMDISHVEASFAIHLLCSICQSFLMFLFTLFPLKAIKDKCVNSKLLSNCQDICTFRRLWINYTSLLTLHPDFTFSNADNLKQNC